MPFPSSSRVLYRHNPLSLVVCQLRFPEILLIKRDPPAEFQERIRGRYPLYAQTMEADMPPLPSVVAELIPRSAIRDRMTPNYSFASEDDRWKANLTSQFIALSTPQYGRWEEFEEHVLELETAAREVYDLPFYTRVGLRYRDTIVRSKLGLDEVPWRELFRDHVIGVLQDEGVSGRILASQGVFVVELSATSRVQVRHGIETQKDSKEQCYVIDSDFYTDEVTKPDELGDTLRGFNRGAGDLFRWCISPRLHEAMEPGDIT